MRKKTFLLWSALLLAVAVYGQKREIHILAVNDMHAAIDAFPQLGGLIDSLRTLDPSLLVFSAGDNRTGNPLNDMYEIPAYPMVALMNQVGFNATTLGNHEFDGGSLPRLIGLSNFSYLCANVFPSEQSGMQILPCQMFGVKGLRVGVIGAVQVGSQGIPSTHPDNVVGYRFAPAKDVIGQYQWVSRQSDVTILLSHIGYEGDIEMAEAFPWLDLIIGGHTHTQLADGEIHNGILITQNKNKLHRATYITLTVENGHVVDRKAEYIDVKKFPKKNKVVEELVRFFSDNPAFRRVLAKAETPFETREELGCMKCDVYLSEGGGEIAIENPGGVRRDALAAGDITMQDVLEIDPFNNVMVELSLTGVEIQELLMSYCRGRAHSFPFVGGMRCELTLDETDPTKVKKVKLLTAEGRKFDMKRTYKVVTNSYVAATSPSLDKEPGRSLSQHSIDMMVNFLEKKKTVDYHGARCLKIK